MDSFYCSCRALFISKGVSLNILVTGANSQIGHFLLAGISGKGDICIALSRSQQDNSKAVRWVRGDLKDDLSSLWQDNEFDVWIHLAALPLALPHLSDAAASGVKHFIVFSSTSIFTKLDSNSENERLMIECLIAAEATLKETCERNSVSWTLFRPTLIYGAGMDKNIGFIRSMIERFGLFPVIGQGDGLRQPVHAEDLAMACLQVMGSASANNRAYNLSGGETLPYRQMVERVFAACDKPVRIVHLPAWLIKLCVSLLKSWPKYSYLNQAMVDRMQMDMVFSYDDAAKDFGYSPRPFQP